MNINEKYNIWLKNVKDENILQELELIKNNENEKHERFYKNLEFGTAGIRSIMEAGTNRLNIYTIRQTAQGLAKYLNSVSKTPVAVISYDSRNNSFLFAKETASVLAANNIKVYISSSLQPTPFLSFAVRFFKADAGVMITASHNSAEYNGFKCYGSDGAQMDEKSASYVYDYICETDIFKDIKYISFNIGMEKGQISFIDENVYEEYLKCVLAQRINKNVDMSNLKVVYTPLNGAGKNFVKTALELSGLKNLKIVSEQENPDGNFTTCPNPNPELKKAFDYAEKYGKTFGTDIIIATDPDSDRLGVGVKDRDDFKILTGNQIGIILFNYIIKNKKAIAKNPILIKSLVSTSMVNAIAKDYNCSVAEVLTGFKNIAAEILKMEKENKAERYLFGFEESNGYLSGTYVRDKDAVSASLLICEAASHYKNEGKNFLNVLEELSQKYGYFEEKTLGFEFKGSEGTQKISSIMTSLRGSVIKNFEELEILEVEDYLNSCVKNYLTGKLTPKNLPKSNIVKFNLKGGSSIIVRPSGTEPKIKFYLLIQEKSKKSAVNLLQKTISIIDEYVKNIY